jgi:hypothetical protein
MWKIILEREIPEAMKPRRIEIESLSGNKQLKDAKLIEQ